MAPGDGNEYLNLLVGGLGSSLAALSAWSWQHTHRRIDAVDKRMNVVVTNESFAANMKSRDERLDKIDTALERQDAVTGKLFDKLEEAMDKTEVRFTLTERQNFDRHLELLKAIQNVADRKKD